MKNDLGETLQLGQKVERLDHYRRGGTIIAIQTKESRHYSVLVRWKFPRRGEDRDQWESPGILTPAPEPHVSEEADRG